MFSHRNAAKEKQQESAPEPQFERREDKKEKPQIEKDGFDDRRDRGPGKDRPPAKKKKEEPYMDRFERDRDRDRGDRDRTRSVPGRGREFVRGRGRGRGRGARGGLGSSRGRGRGDFHSMDRPFRGQRSDRGQSFGHWKDRPEDDQAEGEDVDTSKRRRGRDEESDVSVDETSGTYSESSSERTSEAREVSQGKDKENKDVKLTKETKEEINNTQKSASQQKDKGAPHPREERGRPRNNPWMRDRRYENNDRFQPKPYGERADLDDDSKERGGGYRQSSATASANAGGFTPRGEPSRRGRGEFICNKFCRLTLYLLKGVLKLMGMLN